MKILIKNATIVSESSDFHLDVMDLLVENGIITKIAKSIKDTESKIIQSKHLHVSLGWLDMHANLQDPGFEYKEDLITGTKAAAAGGFTKVCISPLSDPIADNKSQIEYILNRNINSLVDLYPYGTVSKGAKGNELAELSDMKTAGAIAFTDDKHSISNPNLLNRALLYTQSFDGLVLNYPHTGEIAYKGVMNEGVVSTQLGLGGIPELASDLMIARDLYLTEYTQGKLHLSTISTEKSVELIREAKKNGLKVTCDVASYNLLLNENELMEFDSRFKVMPPLRSENTIKSLIKGVKDGTVNAISSDHIPEDVESKKKELDHAAFGIINLQTSFSVANTALKKSISVAQLIKLFTSGPAEVLKIDLGKIAVGERANLTLFDPKASFTFTKEQVISKSKNSPFFKRELSGKVIGVINNKKSYFN